MNCERDWFGELEQLADALELAIAEVDECKNRLWTARHKLSALHSQLNETRNAFEKQLKKEF